VGYPIVVKPPAGMGSKATMRAFDDESLMEALESLHVSPSNPAQAEEFIRGDEHTFETVSVKGVPVWSSSSYYLPGPLEVLENPWMQYCVLLPRETLPPHAQAFQATNHAALKALGIHTGLSHMEWFHLSSGRAVVSEVGARPPGVHLMPLMGLAHGVEMWAKWAELMTFERFEMPERVASVGVCFFRGQGRGQTVRAVHGVDAAQAQAGGVGGRSPAPAGRPAQERQLRGRRLGDRALIRHADDLRRLAGLGHERAGRARIASLRARRR
jgi:hypothetical protein